MNKFLLVWLRAFYLVGIVAFVAFVVWCLASLRAALFY